MPAAHGKEGGAHGWYQQAPAVQVHWMMLAYTQDHPRDTYAEDLRDRCEQAALDGYWVRPGCAAPYFLRRGTKRLASGPGPASNSSMCGCQGSHSMSQHGTRSNVARLAAARCPGFRGA